ncbi:hypothetical protein [Pseudomonas aeruginosa]|uniref:hypothetical protein n=1 Tax=Pseudomonas aeruginosa TaxID=287 RepID=UPI003528A21A
MSKVKRLNFTVDQFESVVPYASEHGQYVRYTDYAKLEAETQSLREEVAALRMARDDFKLERDLARQNFCDEQAANYQLQAHLKACLGELSELRARVVVLPSVDNVMNIVMRYQWNEKTNVTGTTNWAANLGMRVVEVVKRLNGKTVSEGLLRLALEFIMATNCQGSIPLWLIEELRALLNQDKENGNG